MKYDILADWQINTFCNFKCEYCLARCLMDLNSQQNGNDIHKIIKGFDASGLIWWIHMSGGEPFFQPNFVELCRGLDKHFISVNTNLSTKNVNDFAENVNPEKVAFVHCSLHFDERKRLNLIEDFLDKYNLLKRKGFSIYATQVMYPPLVRQFDGIFDSFREKGVILRPKVFRGYHDEKRYPESYTEKERNRILKYSNLSEDLAVLSLETQIDPNLERYFIKGDLSFKGYLCNAGKDFVVITYDGDVIRCHGEHTKMGNIFEGGIKLFRKPKPCSSEFCPCPYYGLKYSERKYRTTECTQNIMDKIKSNTIGVIRRFV